MKITWNNVTVDIPQEMMTEISATVQKFMPDGPFYGSVALTFITCFLLTSWVTFPFPEEFEKRAVDFFAQELRTAMQSRALFQGMKQ